MKIVIDVHDTLTAREAAERLDEATYDADISYDVVGELTAHAFLGGPWSFTVEPIG